MDHVKCTHCQVTMTSWSAPGSPIRYYQCPFCARIHASCYGEAFRRGVGAARDEAPAPAPSHGPPQASAEEIRWSGVKARAARWFARLEAEEHHASARLARALPPPQGSPRAEAVAVPLASAGARPARHR